MNKKSRFIRAQGLDCRQSVGRHTLLYCSSFSVVRSDAIRLVIAIDFSLFTWSAEGKNLSSANVSANLMYAFDLKALVNKCCQ